MRIIWKEELNILDYMFDELRDILLHERYACTDTAIYDAYIKKYWHANDGQSYKRIADAVTDFLKTTEPRKSFWFSFKTFVRKKRTKNWL